MPVIITPLQRLAPRRSWLNRHGVALFFWTGITALSLPLLLVLLTLLVDTLAVRGPSALAALESGIQAGRVPSSAGVDAGLWVQVARFGDRLAWRWLPWLCRHAPLLTSTAGALFSLVVATLFLLVLLSISRTRSRVAAARSARETVTWLRSAIHRQTLRLGPSDLTGQRYQAALKLFVDDAETIREALAQWRSRYVRSCVLLPVLVVSILAIDFRLGLQCLIPTIACWLIFRYERGNGAQKRQVAEAHAETEARFLAEALKQTRLVRGYNMEEFEQSLFARHLERMTKQSSTGRRLERAALSTARVITWAGVALVLLLISLRVVSAIAPLPLSSAVALAAALAWFAAELNSWERQRQFRANLDVSGDRIYRYLDEIPEVGQAVGAKFIEPVSSSIVFEAVHYEQQGHQILRGLDLRIESGQEVAIVSLDALSPRAVAYLLPRFIEPTRGRVLFDGEDTAWGTLESIRAETLYVGSDDPVLSGTVFENIACGDSRYSLTEVIEAAKLVHVHKFITQLPQGYDTVLGQHGVTLAAGEAFRLGLARAAVRNAAVLVIEEPQVLLDEDTKSLIDDAYQRLSAKRTVIYLPGRLSTIRRCDQVVMLHDGVVDGIGPHSELTRMSALYRHWDYVTFNTYSRRLRRLQQV